MSLSPDRRPTDDRRPQALRSAMRPLIRIIVRRRGRLYQPVYLGPLPSRDLVEPDVQGVAELEGVPAYFGLAGDAQRALASGTPAVVVINPEEARSLLEAEDDLINGHQQIIVWGDESVDDLEPGLQRWIEEGGLAFDPSEYARGADEEGFMGPTLARCAREPGALYNPVLLLGSTPELPFMANEAMLRLEAGGLQTVLEFGEPIGPEEPKLGRIEGNAAVIVRLPSGLPEGRQGRAFQDAVETLVARGVQLVIVAPLSAQEEVTNDVTWKPIFEHGITLMVGSSSRRDGERRQDGADVGGDWLPVSLLLVAPPEVREDGGAEMSGSLTRMSLTEILQTMSLGQKSGRVAVFSPRHLGAIDFEQGSIVHASLLGDPWSLPRLRDARGVDPMDEVEMAALASALVEDRAGRIGGWEDARFAVFFGGVPRLPDGERVELDVTGIAMEIARRADEAPRVRAKVGGMDRVWEPVGELESADPKSPLARLWPHLDGECTLQAAARMAGLFDVEALDAVQALRAEGRIEAVGTDAIRERSVPPHRIAQTLLGWGLVSEAATVLSEADRRGRLDPQGSFILGHLQAANDPDLASVRFREAEEALRDGGAGDLHRSALLNALLLEVRNREIPPEHAWRQAREVAVNLDASEDVTPRHRAVFCELALRARDRRSAEAALRALRAARGEEATRLARQSAHLVSGQT